jgi:hypothetical protein
MLLSEGFENAAYSLVHAIERMPQIDTQPLVDVAYRFEVQVDRLRDIFGMQAENIQRAAVGSSMAYTEDDFQKI